MDETEELETLEVDIPLKEMIVIGLASWLTKVPIMDFVLKAATESAKRLSDD